MAKYTIIPKADQTFHVAIVGDDGARQTLLGFETQADAHAWVAQDHWQSVADDSRTPSHVHSPLDLRWSLSGSVLSTDIRS
jgi:hypothetical protein